MQCVAVGPGVLQTDTKHVLSQEPARVLGHLRALLVQNEKRNSIYTVSTNMTAPSPISLVSASGASPVNAKTNNNNKILLRKG